MKDLLLSINERFSREEPVILATVITGRGSAPRKPGAKMVLFNDGTSVGTVGGGALEAAVFEEAARLWQSMKSVSLSLTLNQDAEGGLPMICGGSQEILLAWLAPHADNRQVLARLLASDSDAPATHLLLRLEGERGEYRRAGLGVFDGKQCYFEPEPDSSGASAVRKTTEMPGITFEQADRHTWYYAERIPQPDSLYVFGAGHVARPVVEIATLVGFRTVVLDDREEYACRENFPGVDEIRVLTDFSGGLAELSLRRGAYVVIVTRGHNHDQAVLETVLQKPCSYIGMIGSRTKVAQCFRSLSDKGFGQEQLARVHAPIGLKIGSETPEEIAVSIVAQLIEVRSQLQHSR